ncbi:MAG: hypothetical protein ABEI86_01995 [Halobacteriaceae archaeon]
MVGKWAIGSASGFILVILLMATGLQATTGISAINWAAGGIIGALAGGALAKVLF